MRKFLLLTSILTLAVVPVAPVSAQGLPPGFRDFNFGADTGIGGAGSGTTNYLPIWTSSRALGNSRIQQTSSVTMLSSSVSNWMFARAAMAGSNQGLFVGRTDGTADPTNYEGVAVYQIGTNVYIESRGGGTGTSGSLNLRGNPYITFGQTNGAAGLTYNIFGYLYPESNTQQLGEALNGIYAPWNELVLHNSIQGSCGVVITESSATTFATIQLRDRTGVSTTFSAGGSVNYVIMGDDTTNTVVESGEVFWSIAGKNGTTPVCSITKGSVSGNAASDGATTITSAFSCTVAAGTPNIISLKANVSTSLAGENISIYHRADVQKGDAQDSVGDGQVGRYVVYTCI